MPEQTSACGRKPLDTEQNHNLQWLLYFTSNHEDGSVVNVVFFVPLGFSCSGYLSHVPDNAWCTACYCMQTVGRLNKVHNEFWA